MPNERKMKKVRIDEALLEQIDWFDLFPKGMWSKQAKVNYLIEIGLGVLLLKFEDEVKEYEGKPADLRTQIIRDMRVADLIRLAQETKVPRSQLARLVNRGLYAME